MIYDRKLMPTSCGGGCHNMPLPHASWPFDLESDV